MADGRRSHTGSNPSTLKRLLRQSLKSCLVFEASPAEAELVTGEETSPPAGRLVELQSRRKRRGRWDRKSGREDVCSPAFCSDFTLKLFGKHSTHRKIKSCQTFMKHIH